MIISPEVVLDNGYVVSKTNPINREEQLQPNGIDVRIKSVSAIPPYNTLYLPGNKPKHMDIYPDGSNFFRLLPSIAYNVDCYEEVHIPENIVAYVYGRSTLNRNGIFARSSLYDSGYTNVIGLTIYPSCNFHVKKGERIAQIVFYEAESASKYDGQYKGPKKPVSLEDPTVHNNLNPRIWKSK